MTISQLDWQNKVYIYIEDLLGSQAAAWAFAEGDEPIIQGLSLLRLAIGVQPPLRLEFVGLREDLRVQVDE